MARHPWLGIHGSASMARHPWLGGLVRQSDHTERIAKDAWERFRSPRHARIAPESRPYVLVRYRWRHATRYAGVGLDRRVFGVPSNSNLSQRDGSVRSILAKSSGTSRLILQCSPRNKWVTGKSVAVLLTKRCMNYGACSRQGLAFNYSTRVGRLKSCATQCKTQHGFHECEKLSALMHPILKKQIKHPSTIQRQRRLTK
jgi:hypothetical protein